jgi:hypothetical protein
MGWVAVGITDQKFGGMTNSDILFCRHPQGCSDRYALHHGPPPVDLIDNILFSTVTQENNFTFAQVSRRLVTSDVNQDHPIIDLENTQLIWAYNNMTNSDTAFHTDKGMLNINFLTGNFTVAQPPPPPPTTTPAAKLIKAIKRALIK